MSVNPAPKRKSPSSRLKIRREKKKLGSEDPSLAATEPLRRFVNVEADGSVDQTVAMIQARQVPPEILRPIYDCLDRGESVHINGSLYRAVVDNRKKYF